MADTWQTYFQSDETLLWEGTPLPGIHAKARLIGLSLFGLPFLLMGIAIGITGLRQTLTAQGWNDAAMGLFFAALSIPFAGIGAAMVFGQWVAAAQAHRKIRYALSNRCAYIAKSWWTRSIESYPILRGTPTGLEQGRTADTVWFHVHSDKNSDGDRTTTRVGFDNIADGETVFRLIRSIQMGTA